MRVFESEAELRSSLEFLHPVGEAKKGSGPDSAAVMMLLRLSGGSLEALFEKRAVMPGDRWSGQVAFPGGRFEPSDITLNRTACREFLEETGFDACITGEMVGFMDDVRPANLPEVSVTPFVCIAGGRPKFHPNQEVEELFWGRLLDAKYSYVDITVDDRKIRWRALVFDGRTVWGMTQRIVEQFLAKLLR